MVYTDIGTLVDFLLTFRVQNTSHDKAFHKEELYRLQTK